MAVFSLIYLVFIKKAKFEVPREIPKIGAALCETAGQFPCIYAIGSNAIWAAPMISSYCIIPLVWSRLFSRKSSPKPGTR